jgi:cell division protein FtsQ
VSTAIAAVRRLRAVSPGRALRLPGRLVLAVPAHLRRRALVLAVVAGAFFALYMFVLRDIGLVAVDDVQVSGLTGKDAGRASVALEQAARSSTTLHVDHAAIDEVVARFPVIHSVRLETDFPHGLRVRVIEQRPAAMLVAGGRRIPVAGDGSILTGLPIRDALPVVKVAGSTIPAKQLTPSGTLDAVRVAGGAPPVLTPMLEGVTREHAKGWVVQIKDGPDLIFGPASRLGVKWASAVRVLADRDAAGADYIDLRIPGRPAAGGLPVQTVEPVAPAGSEEDGQSPVQGQAPSTPTPQATPQSAPQTPAPAAPAQGVQP